MHYPSVMGEWQTLAKARGSQSIARFGDGEIKLALGKDAKSQRGAPDLARALRAVLHDTMGPCLPCIPNIAKKNSPKEAFWAQYRQTKYTALYRRDGIYGSAFITRPDSAPIEVNYDYWQSVRELWYGKDVVLVRGSTKSLTASDMVGAHTIVEIVGPRQHAWAEVDVIFERLRRERDRPVILCLGATATVLAHRLAHEGVFALDLGHIGMFMRKAVRGEPLVVTEEDKR